MLKSAEEATYRIPPEERGYYELASAIIKEAIEEYRRLKMTKPTRELQALRDFFLSDVFENISGVENPCKFLVKLDEQIEAEIAIGTKRKRKKSTMKCNG